MICAILHCFNSFSSSLDFSGFFFVQELKQIQAVDENEHQKSTYKINGENRKLSFIHERWRWWFRFLTRWIKKKRERENTERKGCSFDNNIKKCVFIERKILCCLHDFALRCDKYLCVSQKWQMCNDKRDVEISFLRVIYTLADTFWCLLFHKQNNEKENTRKREEYSALYAHRTCKIINVFIWTCWNCAFGIFFA